MNDRSIYDNFKATQQESHNMKNSQLNRGMLCIHMVFLINQRNRGILKTNKSKEKTESDLSIQFRIHIITENIMTVINF